MQRFIAVFKVSSDETPQAGSSRDTTTLPHNASLNLDLLSMLASNIPTDADPLQNLWQSQMSSQAQQQAPSQSNFLAPMEHAFPTSQLPFSLPSNNPFNAASELGPLDLQQDMDYSTSFSSNHFMYQQPLVNLEDWVEPWISSLM